MNYILFYIKKIAQLILKIVGLFFQNSAFRSLDWVQKSRLPTARRSMGAFFANGKIYVIGGDEVREVVDDYIFTRPSGDVLEYSSGADAWVVKGQMITPRTGFALVTSNNKAYVLGGFEKMPNQWKSSQVFEIYDPATGLWASEDNVPLLTTFYSAAATSDGFIYTFGGNRKVSELSNDWEYSGVVSKYNIAERSWSSPGILAPMPTARASLATLQGHDGLIYAIGGIGDGGRLSVVEAYNPETNTWIPKAPMLTARSDLAVVIGPTGLIYAIGGMSDSDETVTTVEQYDPAEDSWTSVSHILTARMFHCAVLTDDYRIFVIGGHEKPSCDAQPVFLDTVESTISSVN